MTSARLVAITFLLSSFLAFAQEQQQKTPSLPVTPDLSTGLATTGTASEPWKIFPEITAKADVPTDALARLQNSRPPLFRDQQQNTKVWLITPDQKVTTSVNPGSTTNHVAVEQMSDATTCLRIRSYQVARDSKDSDSTHLVAYSTCQPASRYQLWTVVESEEPSAVK